MATPGRIERMAARAWPATEVAIEAVEGWYRVRGVAAMVQVAAAGPAGAGEEGAGFTRSHGYHYRSVTLS